MRAGALSREGPLALVLCGSLAISGCMRAPPPAALRPPEPEIGLMPGDAVRVEIWQEPDLEGEFMVSPKGIAVFPLLGERKVTGVPADLLEEQLAAEYRAYLENPSVKMTALRRIAILGEVRQPGLYPVDATMSLTEVIALAGGVSPAGDTHAVRLFRNGVVMEQNLDESMVGTAMSIHSGDQIVVGERSWFRRNATYVTVGIASATSILVALFLR